MHACLNVYRLFYPLIVHAARMMHAMHKDLSIHIAYNLGVDNIA